MTRSFNGSSDDIVYDSTSAFSQSSAVSIHTRIIQDSLTAGNKDIVWKKGTTTTDYYTNYVMRITASGKVAFVYANNPTFHIWQTDSVVITATQEHDILITCNFDSGGSTVIIYVDGVEKAGSWTLGTGAAIPGTATTDLQIGRAIKGDDSGAANYFNGDIGEVALWSSVLSSDHALALSNGTNPFFINNNTLFFYAPQYGTDSPEPDWVQLTTGTVSAPSKARHPPVELLENYL